MRMLGSLMLAAVACLLLALSAAPPANAGFGDTIKRKSCEVSCGEARKKCVKECGAEVDAGACELACQEAAKECVPECVES